MRFARHNVVYRIHEKYIFLLQKYASYKSVSELEKIFWWYIECFACVALSSKCGKSWSTVY